MHTPTEKRPTLTIGILTLNEAHRIKACLESAKFADQLIVVDSGSSDGTAEIAVTLVQKRLAILTGKALQFNATACFNMPAAITYSSSMQTRSWGQIFNASFKPSLQVASKPFGRFAFALCHFVMSLNICVQLPW